MTADVELLPLPEGARASDMTWDAQVYDRDDMDAYARACVEANLAPLQAEVEALRAEVEDYRTNGAAAVRFAPNSAHWSTELRRLFGDDARAGIEVLENGHRQELARAERLAEALRDIAAMRWWYGEDLMDAAGAARDALAQEDRNG